MLVAWLCFFGGGGGGGVGAGGGGDSKLLFVTYFCFSMRCSPKRSLKDQGLDNTVAAIAADNIKADGGGRVVDGKYIPTKEEVLHHKQVRIRYLCDNFLHAALFKFGLNG